MAVVQEELGSNARGRWTEEERAMGHVYDSSTGVVKGKQRFYEL